MSELDANLKLNQKVENIFGTFIFCLVLALTVKRVSVFPEKLR